MGFNWNELGKQTNIRLLVNESGCRVQLTGRVLQLSVVPGWVGGGAAGVYRRAIKEPDCRLWEERDGEGVGLGAVYQRRRSNTALHASISVSQQQPGCGLVSLLLS